MSAPAHSTPPSTPSAPLSARAAVRARRRARLAELTREFASYRSGLVGLALLLLVVALALLAPVLVPENTLDVTEVTAGPDEGPGGAHWLGTDSSGRDIVGLLLWGARASLLVGFAATVMSMVIGTVMGMAAGHFHGWVQGALMRVIDFFLVVPSLVLAIVLSAVLDAGLWTIVIAIGVTSWAGTARVVRAQTLSVESRAYVERSRALGAGDVHVLGRHVLPAILPLVLANTTLTVGSAIIAESTLAFLGLTSSTSSWGGMLQLALSTGAATAGYWWEVLPPGLAIVVVVLAFTLVGRALEAVLNPTLQISRDRA